MPFLEYECALGHVTEQFFKTISEGENTPYIQCPECFHKADKIFSVPLGFGLYGPGFYKPSATKRESYKTVSKKHGNGKIQ